MSQRVLVIAAHPDDEVLGCGGTAALHVRAGDEVTAVIAGEGESLRYGPGGVGQPEHTRRAARMLGLRETRQLGFADQRLDTLSLVDLITPLERVVRDVRPAVVYCQFGGDSNRDHELLFRATLVATRPIEPYIRSEEHTSELQSQSNLVCRLLLEKKKTSRYWIAIMRRFPMRS